MTKTRSQKARAKQAKKNGNRRRNMRELSVREMRRFENKVDQLMGDPSAGVPLVVAPRATDVGLRRKPAAAKRGGQAKRGRTPAPAFLAFLNANKDAFSATLAPPFMSFNPEPSLEARAGRCTRQLLTTVPAGEAYWIMFGQTDQSGMDGLAKHVRGWDEGTSVYALFPFDTVVPVAAPNTLHAAMAVARQLPIASVFSANLNFSGFGSGAADAFTPVAKWPIAHYTGGIDHERAMWTSWGISSTNVTPIGTRGGTHVCVSPSGQSSVNGNFSLDSLPLQPSYHEDGAQQMVRTFHARPCDLSYAHVLDSFTFDGAKGGHLTNPAGIYVFRNDTAFPQILKLVLSAKYAVAGQAAAAVVEPVDATPQHASHYEAASAHVTAGAVPPQKFDVVAKMAHVAQETGTSLIDKVGKMASAAGGKVLAGLAAGAGFAVAA